MNDTVNEMDAMFPGRTLNIRGAVVTVRPFSLEDLPGLIGTLVSRTAENQEVDNNAVWREVLQEKLHQCCDNLPERLTAGEGLLILRTVLELDPLLIEGFSTLVEMMTQFNLAVTTQMGTA